LETKAKNTNVRTGLKNMEIIELLTYIGIAIALAACFNALLPMKKNTEAKDNYRKMSMN